MHISKLIATLDIQPNLEHDNMKKTRKQITLLQLYTDMGGGG